MTMPGHVTFMFRFLSVDISLNVYTPKAVWDICSISKQLRRQRTPSKRMSDLF